MESSKSRRIGLALLAVASAFVLSACSNNGSNTGVEDTSTSGTAAAIVGGANSSTDKAGALSLLTPIHRPPTLAEMFSPIREALASSNCPTILSAAGSGCTQSSSSEVALSFANCSRGSATLNGNLTVTGAGGSVTCGSFPTGLTSVSFGYGDIVRTSVAGTRVTIDSSGAVASPSWATGQGGVGVAFGGGGAKTISVQGVNIEGGNFFHTIKGGSGITLTSNVASGSVVVYHNLLKVMATSSFSGVTFSPTTCCTPISGTITTSFSAITGVATTAAGQALISAGQETLTFNGCGTATYAGADQTAGTVIVDRCY